MKSPSTRWLLAITAAAFCAIYLFPMLAPLDPELFSAEGRLRCAHTIVFFALILEAVAIWVHSSNEEKSTLLRWVAGMFGFAGLLGLTSIAMEIAPGHLTGS